jgi:hypothetical protein
MAGVFEIRGEGGAIAVEVSRYENPDSPDATDRNWLSCRISVDVPPFSGSFEANLLTDDLEDLRNTLREFLLGSLEELSFEPFEQQMTLRVSKRAGGRAHVAGTLRAAVAGRTELSFELLSDQSYLRGALSSLEELERDFPVVGGPHL